MLQEVQEVIDAWCPQYSDPQRLKSIDECACNDADARQPRSEAASPLGSRPQEKGRTALRPAFSLFPAGYYNVVTRTKPCPQDDELADKIEKGGVPAREKAPMSKRVAATGAMPRMPRIRRMSRVS
jgi:hypothetical protein